MTEATWHACTLSRMTLRIGEESFKNPCSIKHLPQMPERPACWDGLWVHWPGLSGVAPGLSTVGQELCYW